jgi:uroporphyrinogen decarboxylase
MKAAVNGGLVDRVPYIAWHHFYLKPAAGPDSGMANAEIRFYQSFQPDLLKVMHDINFEQIGELNSPDDWRSIPVLDPHSGNFGLQLHTLRQIRKALNPDVPIVDTIFGVYFYADELSHGKLLKHLREDPESVNIGLAAIAQSLKLYIAATLEAGCEGIFYALSGASDEGATREEYAQTFKPYDNDVLESAKDAPFNILHLHGYENLYFDLVHDLPAAIINWSDRTTGPSISAARQVHKGCILGGIDEKHFQQMSPFQICNLGRAAIAESGRRHFILGPGCSVPNNAGIEKLQALAEAAVYA